MTEGPSNDPIAADTFDDDSAAEVTIGSSLDSLRSSILENQIENGRTYHSYNAGKYNYPNDSDETDRLEILHFMFKLMLYGEMGMCPKATRGASRVLDLGTGTGCWAIDYADAFPESEVVGVDLSVIQPTMVPPNCMFEIDDLEKEWTWKTKFDFIFARTLCGSFSDFDALFAKAYDALEPGGWFETHDFVFPWACDDNSMDWESELGRLTPLSLEAAAKLGRPLDMTAKFRGIMEKTGFVNVSEHSFKLPIGDWPRDKHYKELGAAILANFEVGLEGLIMALFTRGLQWSMEETVVFTALARKQMRNRKHHAYIKALVTYGQKPLDA